MAALESADRVRDCDEARHGEAPVTVTASYDGVCKSARLTLMK
jgi:hypothetical protein